MKKIVLLRIVAALLMTSLVPPLLAEVGTITYNASYNSSDMILGTDTLGGVTYTTVTYGDLTNGGQPGAPSLPIDYLRFSVPANATNFTVTAVKSDNVLRTINYLVYPCQPPRMMSDTSAWLITPPDNSIYNSGSFCPSASGCAWVADEGFLAGENHIVTVAVVPISFRHRSVGMGMKRKELSLSRTITITLRYELSDSLAMYPIVRSDTTLRNEGYRLTQSMVVNPEGVTGNAPVMPLPIDSINFNPRGGDGMNGLGEIKPWNPFDPLDTLPSYQMATYPYLIVTTPALKNSVRRIAALKQLKGYNVKVVTMDEVLNSSFAGDGDEIQKPDGTYQVVDTFPEGKLRQYLRNCYRIYNTKYVLLVGTDVPYKKQWGNPTDMYYCDLNDNWYMFYQNTTVDKYPELYVGRILAKSPEQIKNYTDKLFRYELNPGHGDYGYLMRIFYSEALDFESDDEWNYVNDSYIKTIPNYTRFLERTDTVFPTGNDIINELNQTRYGYISFMNHAGPSGIVTYGQRTRDEYGGSVDTLYYLWAIDSIHIVYNNQIYTDDTCTGNGLNNLTNKWYPCIGFSSGCETMPFDVRPKYTVETNFGESFTTGKDYGGPAFLGNTRDGQLDKHSTTLEKLFADQLSEGHYKVGEAEAFSRCKYNKDNNTIPLIYNLLGDPEFEIWTDTPQQFDGIEVSRTNDSVIISGINTDSVTVVYRSHNGLHQKMAINKLEDITFSHDVSPNGVVMLYKHNYIPYISPMVLQNVSLNKSHYAIASDVTAGYYVDSSRTPGDVIVKSGVNYEIEASGTVTLEDGFNVERGATFAVYPSCF